MQGFEGEVRGTRWLQSQNNMKRRKKENCKIANKKMMGFVSSEDEAEHAPKSVEALKAATGFCFIAKVH